jgi:hypothetical protein
MAITLDTGHGGNDGFQPMTLLGSGKLGLKKTKNSTSAVRLIGTGLKNGLAVKVELNPAGAPNPIHLWTGSTVGSNSSKTRCRVVLTQLLTYISRGKKKRKRITDDDITVSVTATDTSTGTTSNIITPTVPSGP